MINYSRQRHQIEHFSSQQNIYINNLAIPFTNFSTIAIKKNYLMQCYHLPHSNIQIFNLNDNFLQQFYTQSKMRKIKALIQNKQIITQQPSFELNSNLAYDSIKDPHIVEFYLQSQPNQISKHIIYPLSINKNGESWDIVYNQFGSHSLDSLSQDDLTQLCSRQFLKQMCQIHHQLRDLKPIITTSNIYTLAKQPFKIKIQECCQNEEDYLTNFHSLMKKINKSNKQIFELTNKIKHIQDLKPIYSQPKQGIPISKLVQLKFNNIKIPYQIPIEEVDKNWIFNSIGFATIPKHELIYNGIQHHFDPLPLLKAIFKHQIFYLIETVKGNKIVFYPAVKYQSNSSSIFGTYFPDKQKKSVILGLTKKSIHNLEQQQYAVGYGPQILLAIGKVDIVISAFNIDNICYFPLSYKPDEKSGVRTSEELFGSNTKLKQIQVYKIS